MSNYLFLPVSVLKTFAEIAVLFTIIFTIYLIFKDFELDIKEWWFCAFKSIVYILLAVYIFKYYIKLDRIPVIDFFTFILATFEGSHNFVNSIGSLIAGLIKFNIFDLF
ncbi:hypothetical protein [Desulfosporosinus sp. FKB]|uniref:hypothetical protein n=1 Tax=Desulfosporosinus sp. FKB TaxID=1969835 RepID=UPI000B499A41|nr:hypothetical protein [Desulfosporosinus sp. FKB]